MTSLVLARSAPAVQRLRPRRLFRSAPVTLGYLLLLAATTSLLSVTSRHFDNRLVLDLSTNLHQLARVPVRVLVASAFWLGGWSQLATWAVLLAAVLAPVERRLGSGRTVVVFAAGHVGATLLVAAGLWIGLQLDLIDPTVASARDVGVSYGFFAVAALVTYLLGPRLRLVYAGALGGYVVLLAATSGTFTDYGHLLAVAIGFACYPLARRPAASDPGGLRLAPAAEHEPT